VVFKLRSPAIDPSGHIPPKYTCDGSNLSPPLRRTEPPLNTKSFALIVHDHDASDGATVHWLLSGVAGSLRELPEGVPTRDTVENIGLRGPTASGRWATEVRARPRGHTRARIAELTIRPLPTALNNAMYLIGELTNDETSTRVLAEINLRFARIGEIMSDVRLNRQQDGWAISKPRSLRLLNEHMGCWIC
jgi:phosphatidylethanolamine-binding protein